jgi:hypothetical protein
MIATTTILRTSHRVRRGDLYYEVEAFKQNIGYRATWTCLSCRASRDVAATAFNDAEEQAFACVDAHHLFFHSHLRAESIQSESESPKLL